MLVKAWLILMKNHSPNLISSTITGLVNVSTRRALVRTCDSLRKWILIFWTSRGLTALSWTWDLWNGMSIVTCWRQRIFAECFCSFLVCQVLEVSAMKWHPDIFFVDVSWPWSLLWEKEDSLRDNEFCSRPNKAQGGSGARADCKVCNASLAFIRR